METALVTGATAGIGNAFAHELARRDYHLVLVARDTKRLESTAEKLRSSYQINVEVLAADLSNREDLLRVRDRVESLDNPIDLLVNNAGFGIHDSLLKRDFEIQERAFDVMCLAVLVLGGAAGRAMKTRGRGTIINVGSTSGAIMTGNYSAVKAWVNTYSQALAVELADTG
ncbi:MAG: short-chain dehydrogenase, partial [Propionibacterium sp.]